MTSNTARWGTPFCIAALPVIGLAHYLFQTVSVKHNPEFYQIVLPIIGLASSGFVLFFGHFSYSRLHSAKTFFLGYTLGFSGLLYFSFCKAFFSLSSLPRMPDGFPELLIVVTLINLCIVAFIPAGTKYRVVRSLMMAIVTAETLLLLIFRFGESQTIIKYASVQDPLFAIGLILSTAVILLSLWAVRNEFDLGGIIAGVALLLGAAWVGKITNPAHTDRLHLILLSAAPLYLSVGMVIHGFFRMEHRISYDPLLKIYNRDYCSRIITEQANLNVAPPFAIAMVDIDHFKQVNDTYGHQAGDAVLHSVAQAVLHGAGDDGIVCRYGGEELIVFFPQYTTQEVTGLVEKIRTDIGEIKTKSGKKSITVTISAGISHRESFAQSIVDVIQSADKALYAAKENGRNQVKTKKAPAVHDRK
jgi:diguanylate cyclase (GGDEF)-like protein